MNNLHILYFGILKLASTCINTSFFEMQQEERAKKTYLLLGSISLHWWRVFYLFKSKLQGD